MKNKKLSFISIIFTYSACLFAMESDKHMQAFLTALNEDEARITSVAPYQASKVFGLSRSITKNLPATLTKNLTNYNKLYNEAILLKKSEPFVKKIAELRALTHQPKKIEEKRIKASEPKPNIVPLRTVSTPKVNVKQQAELDTWYTQFLFDSDFLNSKSYEKLNNILETLRNYQQQTQDKTAYQEFAQAIKNHLKTKKSIVPRPLMSQLEKTGKELKELQEQLNDEFSTFLANPEDFFAARTSPAEVKELQKFLPSIKAAQAKDKDAYEGFAQAIEKHLGNYPPVKESKEEIEEDPAQSVAYTHHKHTQWSGFNPQDVNYYKEQIEKAQKEFDENEQKLSNSATRFLDLPGELNKPTIFNIRSIQQMNGWLCGHLLLFNAYTIDQNLAKVAHKPINKNLVINTLLPRDKYNWSEFKAIYNNLTFYGYSGNIQKNSSIDPFTGLRTPASLQDFGNAFLSDDEIIERAQGMLGHDLYIIGKQERQFILQGGTENSPYTFNTQDTQKELKTIYDKKRDIYFACRLAATHWILISIINTGNAQNGRGLLIMDSQNTPLGKEDAGKEEIIALIARAFKFIGS